MGKEHQGGVVGFLLSSTCCVVVALAFRQLGLHGGVEDPIEYLRVAAYTGSTGVLLVSC